MKTRSGRVAYPVVQFSGRGPVAGLPAVVTTLTPVADPLTILAWLTGTQAGLDGRRPVDALHDGDVEVVVGLARRLALTAA